MQVASGAAAGAGLRAAARSAAAVVAVGAVLTAGSGAAVAGAGGRASAPAGCPRAAAPATAFRDLPWAQQRFAPERFAAVADGRGVTVAVLDSGVDRGHPQLVGQLVRGTDLLDPGGDGTLDCVGHGTAVASIIVARPTDGVRFAGLAPGARILPVRVTEQQMIDGQQAGRRTNPEQFAAAIRWAVDHGADVLNLSVALYDEDNPAVRTAIAAAVAADVVVVAAAGNLHERGDPRPYPAAYDGVLGVAAIGQDGLRAAFSQLGGYVDVAAPGVKVLAAAPGGGHQERDGTSYAVPFVSATAALIRQRFPDLSAAQVVQRLLATADPAPGGARSPGYGSGLVNPYRAVTETVGPARSAAPAAVPARTVDHVAAARQARRAAAQQRAGLFAAVGAAVLAVVLLVAAVLPRATRRRWRPADPT